MTRWTPKATQVAVLALVLFTVPGADAAPLRINDPLPFDGDVEVPESAAELRRGAFLLSGALDFSSSLHGAFLAMETDEDTRIDAARIRVFDPGDALSFYNDVPLLEVTNGTLIPDEDASLLWSAPNGTVQATVPYTFSFLFTFERSLPDLGEYGANRNENAPPALVSAADRHPWSVSTPDERSRIFPFGEGFRIQAEGIDQEFEEGDWLVEVYSAHATIRAEGVAAPLEQDANVTFRTADGGDFADGFSVDRLSDFLATAEGLASGFKVPRLETPTGVPECTDPDDCPPPSSRASRSPTSRSPLFQPDDNTTGSDNNTADDNTTGDNTTEPNATAPPAAPGPLDAYAGLLERLGPVLNGALFGTLDAKLQVSHVNESKPGFTLLRFTALDLAMTGPANVHVEGLSPLAFTGGSVVHDENVIPIGPFLLTPLSIGLYVIAIGLFIAMRVVKTREPDRALEMRLRPYGILTGLAGGLAALVLFDREVHFLLGQSFLGTIGIWGAPESAFAALAAAPSVTLLLVELVLWAAVAFLYAAPLTLIGVALLQMGGLGKPVRGFAAGVAAILAWVLGAPLVRPFLDGVMGILLGA